MKDRAELLARDVEWIISDAIEGERQLNRLVVLVDSEIEKEEIMSCIANKIIPKFLNQSINLYRIDLSNISSMSVLSSIVFQKIYESQTEQIRLDYDYQHWIEKLKDETGFIAPGIRVGFEESPQKCNYGYGLFVFDNLDKANDGVLNGVQMMYHDGRNCIIPKGWEFISFCGHGAIIFGDPSFRISIRLCDYNEE